MHNYPTTQRVSKLYVVCYSYCPNTAPTNRIVNFLRGFSELGVEAEVIFLVPDSNLSKMQDCYPHITIRYLWDGIFCIKKFPSILTEFHSEWRFSKMLKDGDTVFLTNSFHLFFKVIRKKNIRVFHEKTEHPDVYHIRGFNIKKYKRLVPKLDGMFVISTALKEYYTSLGLSEDKIHIVNMTVDCNRFKGVVKHTSETYIAYCGTASNSKDGVDELIKSFAIVHEKYSDVKLYIIGNTPDKKDISGNLKLIETLGIKSHIVFTGLVPANDMPQLLKNATILALDRPDSLQAQCGFPTKLGEYLLTENPVVVTKVGDITLFLKDGESALLAEERNPKDVASKLIWALDYPNEAAKIGHTGAEVARKEFNYLNETRKILSAMSLVPSRRHSDNF